MKQALVLGLAFAANAMAAEQVDNELIMAPTDKFSRDLIQKSHGKIMFDEQADDELLAIKKPREESKHSILMQNPELRPHHYHSSYYKADDDDELMVMLPRREHFKTDEEYQKYIAKARYHLDDELFVAPEGSLGELAKKYHGKIMFDEQADAELVAMKKKPFEESKGGMPSVLRPYPKPDYSPLVRETSKGGLSLAQPKRPAEISHGPYYRGADDEELFVAPRGDLAGLAKKYPGTIMFDEQADDELLSLSGADLVKYAKQSQQTVYRPTAHVVRDDADDELAYLGHLIKETQPEKKPETRRHFRHVEKN